MHLYDTRSVFNRVIADMRAAGYTEQQIESASITQSTLILELVANTATNNYTFGVLVNETNNGPVRPTEIRLPLQDMFYTYGVQFLLGFAASAVDTAYPSYSFPNPDIYTTSGAVGALNNLYNGYLSLTVNNKILTPTFDMLKFYKSNQTQFVTGAASPVNQFDGSEDAFIPVEPNWVLQGQKKNVLTLSLPAAVGTLQASITTVFRLILRGLQVQNVTPVS
jgi:hypothetical protein